MRCAPSWPASPNRAGASFAVAARTTAIEHKPLWIGILAGEPSGDLLGAGLMQALRLQAGPLRFRGVGGPRMHAEGLESLVGISTFAMNGFVEPIKRLPSLIRAMYLLRRNFLDNPVDVFVGVDFNVFNLLLERLLKRRGIPTVHYVSPSVYAWRRGRVKGMGRAADLVLTLYPFELPLYAQRGVRAEYVGHPLADAIDPVDTTRAARTQLEIDAKQLTVAMLPGSRLSEIRAHGQLFLDTAEHLVHALGDVLFLVPCVDAEIESALQTLVDRHPRLKVRLLAGAAHRALAAADVVLVKSGTGTLEAMLFGKPMVVTYRLGALSYRIVKALLRTPFIALPNILAGRRLVPELLQDDAQPDRLAKALIAELQRGRDGTHLTDFRALHMSLRRGANQRAAAAVLRLIGR